MKNFLLFTLFLLSISCHSQQNTVWNGKKCAVVLTYDDAIQQQLDNAVPVLDSLKLKASFYLTAFSQSMQDHLKDWKRLAIKGYELGNHTLFHPCAGGKGREWVRPEYDLNNYNVRRMVDEIRMTNVFLNQLDGKTKRTFAFTCGDMKVHDTAFIDQLKDDFIAARAVRSQMHTIDKIDLYNMDCYMVNSNTADQMIEWVKKAEETNSLLIILFHGVGGGNSLNVTVPEHSKFLHYLKKNQKDIWIPTMLEAAEFIKKYQEKNKM